MGLLRKPTADSPEVDTFCRHNIYDILQLKFRWVSVKSDDPWNNGCFHPSWAQLDFKQSQHLISALRKLNNRHLFYVQGWLNKQYKNKDNLGNIVDKRIIFTKANKVIYDVNNGPILLEIERSGKPILLDQEPFENCHENAKALIECGPSCNSLNCINKQSQQGFDWREFLEVRYVNGKAGVGVFSKELLPKRFYLALSSVKPLVKKNTFDVKTLTLQTSFLAWETTSARGFKYT